jgi:4-amino-4-deoxy-L-arabinose transferase-like glycosyltransferase
VALALIGIVALGLTARIAWHIAYPVDPWGDCEVYDDLALNLLDTGSYGLKGHDAERPPGWPGVLAALHWLCGEEADVAWFNIAADTLTIVATFALGAVAFGSLVGLAAALLVAIDLNHIALSTLLCSEPLFALLWLIAALAVALGLRPDARTTFWMILAGVLMGLATLVRPTPLLLLPAVLLAAILFRRWLGVPRSRWFMFVGAFTVTLFPWTLRNWNIEGVLIPVAGTGAINLYIGNNPTDYVVWMPHTDPLWAPFEGMNYAEVHREATKRAIHYAITHPLTTVLRWPAKLSTLLEPKIYFLTFYPKWGGPYHPTLTACHGLWAFTLVGLVAWACVAWLRRAGLELLAPASPAQRWLLFLAGIWILTHLILWGLPRFRHGLEPLLQIFASAGWGALLRAERVRS